MNIEEVFGICLKSLRKSKKISQEQLALKSDLDRTYISMLERGLKGPTINTIFKIALALEIEPSQLIKYVENNLAEKKQDNYDSK